MFLIKFAASVVLTLFLALPARAQQPRTIADPIPVSPVSQIINASGYIFQGTVTQIHYLKPSNPQEVGAVQITFRVSQGIRGARTGQMLSIKEWAGLWDSNDRYRIGQHVMLFLYRPSRLGLTSPIAGPAGKFVIGTGSILRFSDQQRNLFSSDPTLDALLRSRTNVNSKDFATAIRQLAERQP
jgi:hypothetical protein